MRKLIFSLPLLWILLFFGLPCLLIFQVSFTEPTLLSPPFSKMMAFLKDALFIKINFIHYKTLFTNSLYIRSFLSSMILSLSSALGCLIIGYMMAYSIARIESKWKHILLLLVILPFWTSFLIRIYAWMNLLSYQGIINTTLQTLRIINTPIRFLETSFAVGLGIVYCYLPFMILPIYVVLEKLPKDYLEAAFDLGAHRWTAFWRITVPLSKQGILAGFIMVFLPAMGEFVIPELLGGDTLTIGRVLWWEFFHHLDWPMACALSVMIVSLFVIPLTFIQNKEH